MAETKTHRRILVSPLNWGLGHATRLIPIINELVNLGHYVVIAGEGASLSVLRDAFPKLNWQELPGFNVSLSKHRYQWLSLLMQVPDFIRSIKKEQKATDQLIKKYNIDLIISDNRYGVFNNNIASVIITHQTNPYPGKSFAWIRPITKLISTRLLKRFDECWIPDIQNKPNLSGSLSQTINGLACKRIGFLSRLDKCLNDTPQRKVDVLAILSGPEPQRTQLEQLLVNQLKESPLTTIILRAQPDRQPEQINNITLLPHCSAKEQYQYMMSCQHIICRSGYSTLMDLMHCQRAALLIPTPGQFEQQYLAKHVSKHLSFRFIKQKNLNKTPIIPHLIDAATNTRQQIALGFILPQLPSVR